MSRRDLHFVFQGSFLALGFFTTGCTASISTRVSEPVQPRQRAEVEALAIMPVTVESGSEWLRPEAMHRLVEALSERHPTVDIIRPDEAARSLAAGSLAKEYASLLADFERAGVVDPVRVETVLAAVGATHFLHLQAGYRGQGVQRATPNFDGTPFFYSTKTQRIYAVARLWAASSTAPTWEAVVTSESEAGQFSSDRPPSDLVESLVLSVADRAPLGEPIPADPQRR